MRRLKNELAGYFKAKLVFDCFDTNFTFSLLKGTLKK